MFVRVLAGKLGRFAEDRILTEAPVGVFRSVVGAERCM